ncbi:MAG: GNAT family N-acetyltransferase [Gammaproteobacteria bacterium]|nr:GNAT family N-acetyltransferase [Gammaproteobacteria bacterium]
MTITILEHDSGVLEDQEFREQWKTIYQHCEWATPLQSPEFVTTWFHHYRSRYQPVVVKQDDTNGDLTGLLILALETEIGTLVVAGAHQAEYQCWLSLPDHDDDFLINALMTLEQAQFRIDTLKFKYLPVNIPFNSVSDSRQFKERIDLIEHSRPLMAINGADIEKSFKKKSNKSRFNRLKKLGVYEFKRIQDVESFLEQFDQIIDSYDLRQGAINNSFPFQEDKSKKQFHLDWFRSHPELLHITVTLLDDNLVAAHIGVISQDAIHLAILAYSPFFAAHSPGKLHLMQLSRLLNEEGFRYLDLTPGGDPWKERFATEHDKVYELVIHASKATRQIKLIRDSLVNIAKTQLGHLGVSPQMLRKVFGNIKKINLKRIVSVAGQLIPGTVEMRIYRFDSASIPDNGEILNRMRKNSISDILQFDVVESWQDKQEFTLSALNRLEQGESCYTLTNDGKLQHFGWMIPEQKTALITEVQQSYQYPSRSTVLYDFYTDPEARGKGMYQDNLRQMLNDSVIRDSADYVYISVKADNVASRHVIEKTGFEYQESLFHSRFLWINKQWQAINN